MNSLTYSLIAYVLCMGSLFAELPDMRNLPIEQIEAWADKHAQATNLMRFDYLKTLNADSLRFTNPASWLVLPIKSYPDGKPKNIIQAKQAHLTADTMMVKASWVTLLELDPEGKPIAEMWAEHIIFDRTKMLGYASGLIFATYKGDTIIGQEALIDANTKQTMITQGAALFTDKAKSTSGKTTLF